MGSSIGASNGGFARAAEEPNDTMSGRQVKRGTDRNDAADDLERGGRGSAEVLRLAQRPLSRRQQVVRRTASAGSRPRRSSR